MARPNNPGASAGGQPPQRQHGLEGEPQQQSQQQPHWPPPQPPQAAPSWPPQQPQQRQPQPDPYAAAGYHYPQPGAHSDTYAAPPQQPPARADYAQQPERYAPPPAAPPQFQAARPAPQQQHAPYPPQHQPQHYAQQQPQRHYADPAAPGYPPQQPDPRSQPRPPLRQAPPPPPHAPAAELRGTLAEQWPPQHASRGAPADPRGYDLSAYAAPPQLRPTHEPQPQQPYATAAGRAGQPPQFAQADAQSARAVVAETEYAADEVYDEEPPRRSRGLLIVGALVGAIALGGGLAYAYKMFLQPSASGKTPVVRADTSPTKTAPAAAGGKQFANRDMKVPGRVTDGAATTSSGGAVQSASASEDGTTRRVSTVTIGRDGAPVAPPPAPEVAPPSGLVVMRDPLRSAPPGMSAPVLPPVGQRPAPPTEPRTVSLPEPKAAPPAPPPVAKAQVQPKLPPRPAPPQAQAEEAAPPPVAKKPQVRTAAVPPPAKAGVSGYVAVLSSQRSSMDALKMFADLQQKYSVLQGRSPNVVEANVPDKGVFHRLVVGPPGPRDQATSLCSELKAAGYQGCWVTAQ